jgi:hypothetical protein
VQQRIFWWDEFSSSLACSAPPIMQGLSDEAVKVWRITPVTPFGRIFVGNSEENKVKEDFHR